jgi:hypothetical protein
LHVVCDASDGLAIGSFTNAGGSDFADIVAAARAAGYDRTDVDYAIFYDDSARRACGTGSYIEDSRPTPDNANNSGGGYAVVYSDCWAGSTPLHEVAHTQGAVQPDSPYSTGSAAHCRDERDVMCYADGGERDAGMIDRCMDREHFDCGHDDYFDVAPQKGEYLATHWNLGSPENAFITLGGPAAPDPDVPMPEEPAEEEEADEPPVLIVRMARTPSRPNRVRLVLACPVERVSDCRGTARLLDRGGRGVTGRGVYAIAAGRQRRLSLRLRPQPLRLLVRRRAIGVVASAVDAATARDTRSRFRLRLLR